MSMGTGWRYRRRSTPDPTAATRGLLPQLPMPRAHFPHTLNDVLHAVDGPFGLVVGDLPDGTIWVLKRGRKEPGYTLTHYADAQRSGELGREAEPDRRRAINRFAELIVLPERL